MYIMKDCEWTTNNASKSYGYYNRMEKSFGHQIIAVITLEETKHLFIPVNEVIP